MKVLQKILILILGHIFQLINMLVPLVFIAIIMIGTIASFWLGVALTMIFWYQHTKHKDGLFYAWKIENIKSFYKSWNNLNQ